jgi:hypothetical protein
MENQPISNGPVKAKTGKTWKEWFTVLDADGCEGMSHKEIVAVLQEKYRIDDWWQQSVTVAYEQVHGQRLPNQRPDGFQISKSKTIPSGMDAVFNAWSDPKIRSQWLEDPAISRVSSFLRSDRSSGLHTWDYWSPAN